MMIAFFIVLKKLIFVKMTLLFFKNLIKYDMTKYNIKLIINEDEIP